MPEGCWRYSKDCKACIAAVGQEHVSRQRERIAQLERRGRDVCDAGRLLALLEGLQSMHIAHRDRLALQLGNAV
jgi:hypothetical protein